MKNVWDKIIHEAKQVSLNQEERDLLMSQIKKHMSSRPILESGLVESAPTIASPYLYKFKFALSLHEKRFVPLAVILILILFGGTSFAANYALPGETLYSMKVNVNEQVESWMALSPNANARFEVVKAERRLKEAEKLTVKKKKITPKAKAQIKENFTKNAGNLKKMVAEIEASGDVTQAAEVKADFENKLEAHAVVLSKLASDEGQIIEIDAAGKEDVKEIHALVDEHITELKTQKSTEEAKDLKETEDMKEDEGGEAEKAKSSSKSESVEAEESAETLDTLEQEASLMSIEDTTIESDKLEQPTKSEKEEAKRKINIEEEKRRREVLDEKIEAEVKIILKELDIVEDDK